MRRAITVKNNNLSADNKLSMAWLLLNNGADSELDNLNEMVWIIKLASEPSADPQILGILINKCIEKNLSAFRHSIIITSKGSTDDPFKVESKTPFRQIAYAPQMDDWSLVHLVAYNGKLTLVQEIFKLPVEKRGNINHTESAYGFTPLHIVALLDRSAAASSLINEGANIGAKDKNGKTPLDIANELGKTEVANFLRAKQREYDSQLLTAVHNGDVSQVTGLLDKGANILAKDKNGKMPLDIANELGKTAIANFLRTKLDEALFIAVQSGNVSEVTNLLNGGANIEAKNNKGKTPLDVANEFGKFEALRLLINKAIEKDKLDLVISFLDKSAKAKGIDVYDPDGWRHNWKVIHHAVYYGNLDIVRDILKFPSEKVGSVHSVGDGWVIIHYAVYYNRKDVISFLIDQGSNVDAKTSYGRRTPLHIAVEQDRLDMAALLISKGANINALDYSRNQTPIQKARAFGKSDIVKLLEYVISNNSTSLHYAAREDKLELANFLLNNGANILARDKNGKTPLDIANEYGKTEIANFLRAKQSEKSVQRKRRHHHGDHPRHHSGEQKYLQREEHSIGAKGASRNIENVNSAIEGNQQATSGASKPSSWINVFANTIVDAVKGVSQFISSPFKPAIDMEHSQPSNAMATQSVDTNGTLLLLDVFIRKITGQKYISTADQPVSLAEAMSCALGITTEFKRVLKDTAKSSCVSVDKLSFDFLEVSDAIAGKMISGELSKIPTILYSSVKEAYPRNEKFLGILKDNIKKMLNERQIVNNRNSSNQTQSIAASTNNEMPLSSLNNIAIEPVNGKKGVTFAGRVG
ncbi:MAG: ankyrin repeat domain-containing protein [Wolbachia sp.]